MEIESAPRGRLEWQVATIVEAQMETPRARRLTLRAEQWGGHIPGQHIDIRLTAPDGYQAQRSYSITSPPQRGELEIVVDHVPGGEVSPFLTQDARVDDRIELRGPIGGYFIWTAAPGQPLVLIAGGSGIAPLASMLAHRATVARGTPTRVLYSVRTASDFIFDDRLARWAQADSSLELFRTVTRLAPADWPGFRGRIDAAMLKRAAFAPSQHPVSYVCGPTGMVESTASALVRLGHPAERILTERFGPSGS